jgi:hypothetical protein
MMWQFIRYGIWYVTLGFLVKWDVSLQEGHGVQQSCPGDPWPCRPWPAWPASRWSAQACRRAAAAELEGIRLVPTSAGACRFRRRVLVGDFSQFLIRTWRGGDLRAQNQKSVSPAFSSYLRCGGEHHSIRGSQPRSELRGHAIQPEQSWPPAARASDLFPSVSRVYFFSPASANCSVSISEYQWV